MLLIETVDTAQFDGTPPWFTLSHTKASALRRQIHHCPFSISIVRQYNLLTDIIIHSKYFSPSDWLKSHA